jgi:hypothetical protein
MILSQYFSMFHVTEITTGLISLIAIALLLTLSESYDNLAFGKVIRLSRLVKDQNKEIERRELQIFKVESERNQLISQLIAVSTNVNQLQNSTNHFNVGLLQPSEVSITRATEQEVKEDQEKVSMDTVMDASKQEPVRASKPRRRLNSRLFQSQALEKYATLSGIEISAIHHDVKLREYTGLDPVSDESPIYKGYINDIDLDVFVEVVRPDRYFFFSVKNRLYAMLTKIFHYSTHNNRITQLVLVVVKTPDDEANVSAKMLEQLYEVFRPALSRRLLRVVHVEFSDEEMEQLRVD